MQTREYMRAWGGLVTRACNFPSYGRTPRSIRREFEHLYNVGCIWTCGRTEGHFLALRSPRITREIEKEHDEGGDTLGVYSYDIIHKCVMEPTPKNTHRRAHTRTRETRWIEGRQGGRGLVRN